MNVIQNIESAIEQVPGQQAQGVINRVSGLTVEATLPGAFIGEICTIVAGKPTNQRHLAEVIGFSSNRAILMPYTGTQGIGQGDRVTSEKKMAKVKVGPTLLGRVVNAFGEPLDDCGPIIGCKDVPLTKNVINPMDRAPIERALQTGVRAIDGFTTIGLGQRLGLMAGSGVGKSVLLSEICKQARSDINVVALIGERGREVEEFVSSTLGEQGLDNTVVIAATAQDSPLVRAKAAYSAIAIAEYFAQQGKDVFLTMDSITRFATALREIGLSAGEPPTVKGYTPSVFSVLPDVIERCGNFKGKGSITAIFTVLVESDDFTDPVVDCVRAILDGHLVLTRELAEQGHYPAIDIAKSVSRLFTQLHDDTYQQTSRQARSVFAEYQQNRDMLSLGLFENDESSKRQALISKWQKLQKVLLQGVGESSDLASTLALVQGLEKG